MHRHLIKNLPSENEIISNWESKDVLLSITCTAYNHANFIAESIKGFLIQRTTFPFEIIIHDDASSDDSQSIILKYAEYYPALIKPILQKENQWLGKGINATVTFVWPSALGKYIAWCEGDDYWTDPYKLQRQVDYLEANPECFITSHNVWVNTEDRNGLLINSVEWLGRERQTINTLRDIIRHGSGGATCSLVFRSSVLPFPGLYSTFSGVDVALQMLLTSQGYMYYFKEPMGVYRKNAGSVTLKKNIVKVFRDMGLRPHLAMKKMLGKKYCEDFDFHVYDYYLPNLMIATKQEKKHFQFLQYWIWHQWLKFRFRVKKM